MKKLLLSATFAFTLLATTNTFAQQGFGTNTPDKSAAVDIVSSKRGLLIPRVALTATNSNLLQVGEITAPANSLFVYNTATTIIQRMAGEVGAEETAVTPGFYYWERTNTTDESAWQGKWVRFVSTNQEKSVVVSAGENVKVGTVTAGSTTTYTVGVQGGTDKQVLVTKVDNGVTTTEWIDPNDFVNNVLKAGNAIGISTGADDKIEIKFNGTLTENTTIATGAHNLAITGLDVVDTAAHIMVMDANGLLQKMTKEKLFDAKDMTSTEGIITLNGIASAEKSVLAGVVLGVAERSIAPGKFKAEGTDAGKVPVVNNDGTVDWKTIPGTSAADLTTDGKIVIGATEADNLSGAVLKATALKIKAESLTSTEIMNGTIETEDMKPGGNTTVLVTDATGFVSWIEQSDLANKDNYNFTAPLTKNAGVDNATGGKDFTVNIKGAALTSSSITVAANEALLADLNIEITPGTIAGQVLTTTGTGADLTTSWGTPNSLVAVNNGLNKNTDTGAIHLGGALIEATTINTQSHEEADKNFTLAITGLTKAPETTNKVIVAEAGTGVLRTVDKVVTGVNIEVASNDSYSFHTPEVMINVTLANTDQTIVFPDADKAVGQTINIKIANTTDTHTGYLNVLNTYGSMPYQGWIVKSDGANWVIVGRN